MMTAVIAVIAVILIIINDNRSVFIVYGLMYKHTWAGKMFDLYFKWDIRVVLFIYSKWILFKLTEHF